MKTNPAQDAVDFCASTTMEWLGTLPLPAARKYLTGSLLLTPEDSPVTKPFREMFDQLSEVENKRTRIATGQLTLNLGVD